MEQWITEVMINEPEEIIVPDTFTTLFQSIPVRQMLIEELVRNKGSFLGSASDNIIKIYNQLGLNLESRKKLESKEVHIQCQGIHELCVMEQKDQTTKVYRMTNSRNYDVRVEAQTALIQWYGFKGLRFLDVAAFPITEFQQLKLLELLRPLPFRKLIKLNNWIVSANDTVASFALKLAEHYKQEQVHDDAVTCLYHINESVRVQAVKTLARIGDASTAALLTQAYLKEKFTNRLNILRELPKIAGYAEINFLIEQLYEGHEHLKLAAAKVLVSCVPEGLQILEEKANNKSFPYKDIYLHVKAETQR
jgi:hypothetical protein